MIYDDKKFIGNVIKNARKKAKMSQAELSELINMCDKNLGNIENGKQFPQVNNFLRIIEVLNLSLSDFGVSSLKEDNEIQQELLKLIYSADDKKRELYLETLKFVDRIL